MKIGDFRELCEAFLEGKINDFPDEAYEEYRYEIENIVLLDQTLRQNEHLKSKADEVKAKAERFEILQKAAKLLHEAVNYGTFFRDMK